MQNVMVPAGIDNFRKLVTHKDSDGNSYIFVDKTMFIKDFIDGNDYITLITRPRRFGKTINLSMLEHFFNKEVNGKPTKGLFDGLKISKLPNVMAYQGNTPAIFISFKEIKGDSFEEAYRRFKELIRKLFKKHKYLLDFDIMSSEDKIFYKSFLSKTAYKEEYETSLHFLSNLLHDVYGKNVYIFLDEYDTPLHNAYVNNYYEKMRSFIASMFNQTLKGNSFVEKALITGIIKIAKSSLFSELNNVGDYTCLDSPLYSDYFGFTEEETNEYLDKAGLPAKAHQLKQMYNGYCINGTTLYNPYSIVKFINRSLQTNNIEESVKPYWINTGGHGIIRNVLSSNIEYLQEDIARLLNNIPIKTPINENIIMGNYLKGNSVSFWSLMLLAGYLKPISEGKKIIEGFNIYELEFPNQEVKESFNQLVINLVANGIDKAYTYILAMQSLAQGQIKEFNDFLVNYMKQTPSYFDVNEGSQEKFYHGMILGMTACLYNTHIIRSNRESGEGRYDICLEPKNNEGKGIIIELKAGKDNEDLGELAKTAYEQIQKKDYAREMESKDIKEIIPVGIAFSGKEVKVKYNLNQIRYTRSVSD